jgi:hypothetical protein
VRPWHRTLIRRRSRHRVSHTRVNRNETSVQSRSRTPPSTRATCIPNRRPTAPQLPRLIEQRAGWPVRAAAG